MRHAGFILLLLALTTSNAHGFLGPGHEAIADVAQDRLSPAAQAALGRILQNTSSLSPGALKGVATWLDDVRNRAVHGTIASGWSPDDVQEADDFNQNHPRNSEWHFVNLPLGAAAYPNDPVPAGNPLRAFVGPDDVVHALMQAIQILETPGSTDGFSKLQAVRVVVHLVGDIHQPLHVTTGYYDTKKAGFKAKPVRIDDPTQAAKGGVLGDRGGNGLSFSVSSELHALWDGCLPNLAVQLACSASNASGLAARLRPLVTPAAVTAAATPGDYHGWAALWVTDSLHQAVSANAYVVNLANGVKHVDPHTHEASVLATITSPTKASYPTAERTAATQTQLVKAAVRLADLLNAIAWK